MRRNGIDHIAVTLKKRSDLAAYHIALAVFRLLDNILLQGNARHAVDILQRKDRSIIRIRIFNRIDHRVPGNARIVLDHGVVDSVLRADLGFHQNVGLIGIPAVGKGVRLPGLGGAEDIAVDAIQGGSNSIGCFAAGHDSGNGCVCSVGARCKLSHGCIGKGCSIVAGRQFKHLVVHGCLCTLRILSNVQFPDHRLDVRDVVGLQLDGADVAAIGEHIGVLHGVGADSNGLQRLLFVVAVDAFQAGVLGVIEVGFRDGILLTGSQHMLSVKDELAVGGLRRVHFLPCAGGCVVVVQREPNLSVADQIDIRRASDVVVLGDLQGAALGVDEVCSLRSIGDREILVVAVG